MIICASRLGTRCLWRLLLWSVDCETGHSDLFKRFSHNMINTAGREKLIFIKLYPEMTIAASKPCGLHLTQPELENSMPYPAANASLPIEQVLKGHKNLH